jgi:cephalosporin hydroxylase
MTAVDDFVAEHDEPVRVLFIPIYFGLAIVVEHERLTREPALAAALDHLESAEGRKQLLKVAEDVRIRAMLFQHNVYFQRNEQLDRAVRRYLDVFKAALLNEHYLENEVRITTLVRGMRRGRMPEARVLRDPARHDQETYRQLVRERKGAAGPDDAAASSFLPYTAMGRTRLDHLEQCLDVVRDDNVRGDLVECGTGHGGGAIFLRGYLDAHEIEDRVVWVADRFRSTPEPDRAPRLPPHGVGGFQADLNLVRDGFERFGLLDDRVRFLEGSFDATLPDAPLEELALLRIGRGIGGEVRAVLDNLYDRIAPGGFVVLEDHADAGCRKEVEAFRADRGITTPLSQVDWSTVAWRKPASEPSEPGIVNLPIPGSARPPLAPAAPTDELDVTVVVVFYNMRREAERTLRSLSRAYQEDIDDVSYEVIVVENGSSAEQRLGAELVESFGPEFRYVDLGTDATPSPAIALNRGIRLGRGNAFALMIDGAHVLTPGVLRFGVAGLRTYAPAIVATQQWYVGPGQQGDAMDDGYDRDYEDRLFANIEWPTAGYRLFEIGHFIGDRDWLDGVWESNCMFVPRKLLEQVGCFDESFTMAGGGYANLELYERLGTSPDVTVVTILGEGSFHQLHGGDTTNERDATERRTRVYGYSQHYAELRGRPFRGPGKPIHYVGRIQSKAARRTKPRRLSAAMFAESAHAAGDGFPSSPTPVPDELAWEFTDAVWRSLPWDRTTWLGRRITSAPTDLLAYQELVARVRPDCVIEVGTGDGGRALFLASICELVGHGQVLSMDEPLAEDLPQHPRLRYLAGAAHDADVARKVHEAVGDVTCLVVLGAAADRTVTAAQFEAFAPLVPVGSYVVVADTIVNGHPVWPAFGDGPAEATKQILTRHGEFATDPTMEKYSLTFNPGGFLKRVR